MSDTERLSDIQKKTELSGQRLVKSLDRPVMDSCCLLGYREANSFVAADLLERKFVAADLPERKFFAADLLERRHFTDY